MKAKYLPSPTFHICWQTLDKLHTFLVVRAASIGPLRLLHYMHKLLGCQKSIIRSNYPKLVFGHLHILKWVLYFGHYSCINFRRGITVSEKIFCIRLDQNGPAANRAFSNFCSSVSKSGSTSTLDSLLPEF